MDRPLIVLDTESASNAGAPHLVELAAVRVEHGEVQDHFQALVRPQVPVSPEATEIHGLTDQDLVDAEEAGPVLIAFLEWAGDDWLAAHNAPADAKVLAFEAARTGTELPPGAVIDSLPLSKQCLPDAPDHKLPTLTEYLNLEVAQHHRALDDATSCWKVIEACMERLGGVERVTLAELLANARRPLTLQTGAPHPPRRFPRRLRPLAHAAREGRSVVLVYGENQLSPAQLPVRPRLLYQHRDHDYLEAECEQSGLLKTYRLDRVHRVLAG